MNQKEIKIQAEQLWIKGESLNSIASSLGIKMATIRNWYFRYDWASKREDFQKKLQETLYCKLISKIEDSISSSLDIAVKSEKITIEALELAHDKCKQENKYEEYCEQILKWVSIADKASSIHRKVMPNADDEISQRILNELSILKQIVYGKKNTDGDK